MPLTLPSDTVSRKALAAGFSGKPGDKPSYVPRQVCLEHWRCDGSWLYELDSQHQQIVQRELPAEVRAPAAARVGVPFLFGASLEVMRQRYGLRLLPVPDGDQDQHWLEAIPGLRQDTARYQRLHVIIDQADFLPRGLVVVDRNFDSGKTPARTVYAFENREVNWNDAEGTFDRELGKSKVPEGWKKVVETLTESPR